MIKTNDTSIHTITEEQIADFQRDGVVVIRDLVDSANLRTLAAAIEDDIRNPGPYCHGYKTENGMFHGTNVFGSIMYDMLGKLN